MFSKGKAGAELTSHRLLWAIHTKSIHIADSLSIFIKYLQLKIRLYCDSCKYQDKQIEVINIYILLKLSDIDE